MQTTIADLSRCTPNNDNQVFNIVGGNTGPSSSSSTPSSTSSSAGPSSTPNAPSWLIHPKGKNDQCVTIQNGYDGVGTKVAM